MELTIYKQNGEVRAVVSPSDNSTHSKQVMGDNVINLSFILDECVKLAVNDYIEFQNETFRLLEDYRPLQKSTIEYEYDVQFWGIESELKKALVLFMDGDNEPTFPLTDTAEWHLQLVIDNINRIKGTRDWIIGELVADEEFKTIQYDNTNCFDALRKIADTFGTEWWIEGTTINLSRCEHSAQIELSYEQKGLKNLSKETNDQVPFFTRLFPIGSTRNIDKDKYGYNRLRLPGGKQYVERNTHLGIVEYAETEAFSHIYPRRVGTISSVRESAVTVDGVPRTIYFFRDDQLPFDPNNYEIHGVVKNIVFQSGNLSGQSFEVNYNSSSREFEIINQYPYENMQLPGGTMVPIPGNKYIIFNISMPDEYYTLAEKEMEEAVGKWLDKHAIDPSIYKAPTDPIYFEQQNIRIKLGHRVKLISPEYFEEGFRDSRITGFSRKLNNHFEADLEFSYAVSAGRLNKIENNISDIEAAFKERLNQEKLQVLKTWDNSDPTDYNVFSSLRARMESISRRFNDIAYGIITFLKGINIGEFVGGITGTGARIDEKGNGEMESLTLRRFLEVPELRYNRIDVIVGDKWRAPGGGIIEEVDTAGQIITLKLEEGELGNVKNGDICMGIFHSYKEEENATADTDDSKGNRTFAGFYTTYFTVVEVLDTKRTRFRYQLRSVSSSYPRQFHPCPAMHFVGYGSFTDKDRQTSCYETRTYQRYLVSVDGWEFERRNVAAQFGDLSNLSIHGLNMTGYSAYLNNIYMTGIMNQISGDGETESRLPFYKGMWTATGKYAYYDYVAHEGSLWLCTNQAGSNTEPSDSNPDWLEWVERGKDGEESMIPAGRWLSDKTPYKKGSLVSFARATFLALRDTSVPPVALLTSGGQYLTSGGYYLLRGSIDEYINGDDWQMITPPPVDGLNGQDGQNGISISWKGDLQIPPANPSPNWVYRSTIDGCVYIYNGTRWELMVVDGDDGADGAPGDDGFSVFITYHDSEDMPATPTGTGTTGGWHTNTTSAVIWMSQKVAESASSGTWGTPIRIRGEVGIIHAGRWQSSKVPYKQRSLVTFARAAFLAKRDTSAPPVALLTSGGRYLTSGGNYIPRGKIEKYINSADWELLIPAPEDGKDGKDGQDGKDGKDGADGKTGIQGQIIRPTEWMANFQYRNDGEEITSIRYLDVVTVTENTSQRIFQCLKTHTSTTANKPPNTEYWQEFNSMQPIYTSLLMAANSAIRFMQGQQLLIQDSTGKVVGGLSGKGEGANGIREWWGSPEPTKGKYRVDENGKMIAEDAEVTGKIIATSGEFTGTLKGVTGTFNSLNCVDNQGKVVGSISFGTNGDITFQGGGLMHQASTRAFFASDIFVRGAFGARSQTAIVVYGTYAYYYPYGLDEESRRVYVTLSSHTNTSNKTYYRIPLYGTDGHASGCPVDLVIIRATASSDYRYELYSVLKGKRVTVINANDNKNNIYVYSNGYEIQMSGGTIGDWTYFDDFLYPVPPDAQVGRGWIPHSFRDSNWA